MPLTVQLRDNFNGQAHTHSSENVDWVTKFYYSVDEKMTWYAGAPRKSRAPAYQEQYLWLPLQATADTTVHLLPQG